MSTIVKYYNQIKKNYLPRGFFKNKQMFVREKEGVLQSFSLKRFRWGSRCTVEFGIYPLCLPIPVYLDAGPYELHNFTPEQRAKGGWSYDDSSEESMANCIQEITDTIDRYLMPLFDSCYNCEKALTELEKVEELFDNNRKKVLKWMETADMAKPLNERALFDYRKYYMALKSRNYDYAERYLEFQVSYREQELNSLDKAEVNQPKKVVQKMTSTYNIYKEHFDQLTRGNHSFFENLVEDNEDRMRAFLASEYPAIWKKTEDSSQKAK